MNADRYVHTIALRVDPATERELRLRFEVARKIYNALLGEAQRRIGRVRHELTRKEHAQLRAACKGEADAAIDASKSHPRSDEAKAIRRKAYEPYRELQTKLRREHQCSAYGLMSHGRVYATQLSRDIPRWAAGHAIGATLCTELAKRAWRAAEKYLRDPRISLHFVRYDEMRSVESMNAADAIRVCGDEIIWSAGVCKVHGCVRAEHPACAGGTIRMQMRLDRTGRDVVESHARSCQIVKTRVLRKRIRGRWRYYAQIVLAGEPARREWLASEGTGSVGVDLGLSVVAVDCEAGSAIYAHAADKAARANAQRLRCIERALDRSRRATNPECFDTQGRWRPGARINTVSRRYHNLRAQKTELNRVVAQERDNATKTLANLVASQGNRIYAETFDYRKWAKEYGYSAKGMAPGAFFDALRRRAEANGADVREIPTHVAKLSQACHECGAYEPRCFAIAVLARRQHCSCCGSDHDAVQADLYQAFLARHVRDEGTVDLFQARKGWSGARTRLAAASSTVCNAEKIVFGRSSRARDRAAADRRAAASHLAPAQGPASFTSPETRWGEAADSARRAPWWGEAHTEPLDPRTIVTTATESPKTRLAEGRKRCATSGARKGVQKSKPGAAKARTPSQR